MVNVDVDATKYEFTTKSVLDNFNIDENVIYTRGLDLFFSFAKGKPSLVVENQEFEFESTESMIFFLQKLSLNSTLITSLSNDTLMAVANERLEQLSTFNLLIDKNTNRILTVTPMTTDLVSWKRILKTIHDFFLPFDEKILYLTTFTGLGISIKMNDSDNSDLDVIRVEPQTSSSISIYRGVAKEDVPLRGYDEDEIMVLFKEKLQIIISVDPSISKNYSLV